MKLITLLSVGVRHLVGTATVSSLGTLWFKLGSLTRQLLIRVNGSLSQVKNLFSELLAAKDFTRVSVMF